MIHIKNLSKSFGSKQVLKNINLSFQKGTVNGIVGDNGAGKTTLFRCIAGLEPYEGEIVSDLNILKDHLGLLMTDPYFFPLITGREYIQLLCNARSIVPGNVDEKNIFDLPLSEYASTYSTGMKKKLALTAILRQENEVFILDEPFNGVDIHSNMIIAEIIYKLKSLGKTVLISSHIFSTLSETCDLIYLLQEGAVAREVKRPDFANLEQEMKAITLGDKVDRLGLR
jgi:ABC-2 type transport system ATP-binding protein